LSWSVLSLSCLSSPSAMSSLYISPSCRSPSYLINVLVWTGSCTSYPTMSWQCYWVVEQTYQCVGLCHWVVVSNLTMSWPVSSYQCLGLCHHTNVLACCHWVYIKPTNVLYVLSLSCTTNLPMYWPVCVTELHCQTCTVSCTSDPPMSWSYINHWPSIFFFCEDHLILVFHHNPHNMIKKKFWFVSILQHIKSLCIL
jgi:hypothetical protein